MKFITDTKQGLIDAIKHYVGLRLEFRSSAFTTAPAAGLLQENCRADFCSVKR